MKLSHHHVVAQLKYDSNSIFLLLAQNIRFMGSQLIKLTRGLGQLVLKYSLTYDSTYCLVQLTVPLIYALIFMFWGLLLFSFPLGILYVYYSHISCCQFKVWRAARQAAVSPSYCLHGCRKTCISYFQSLLSYFFYVELLLFFAVFYLIISSFHPIFCINPFDFPRELFCTHQHSPSLFQQLCTKLTLFLAGQLSSTVGCNL